MQRKFVATATKLHKLLVPTSPEPRFLAIRGCRTDPRSVNQTADPKFHGENPEATYDNVSPAISGDGLAHVSTHDDDDGSYEPPKNPILRSNPKIKRPAVNPPPDPFTQQKRSSSTSLTSEQREDIICVGFDGSPWPEDEKGGRRRDRGTSRKEAEEDDKEYFKHHKASPLSELEISDTRKPITRATDGSADSRHGDYGGGGGVVVWKPEQIDTAEDSLRRAMEIWKQNAMRGDPDSPHGRVLRELRGEYW